MTLNVNLLPFYQSYACASAICILSSMTKLTEIPSNLKRTAIEVYGRRNVDLQVRRKFTDFLVHNQPTSYRSLILAKCESNELTPLRHTCLFVGGCTVKQAIYGCYHRLISWRATFRYYQMC